MESESNSSLEHLLHGLQAEGTEQGVGGFSIDPERAIELLHQQGKLGENAFIFLLKSIYDHTQGARVLLKKSARQYRLQYPSEYGIVSRSSVSRVLAQGAFEAFGLEVAYEEGKVTISSPNLLGLSTSVLVDGVLEPVLPRLKRYPFDGLHIAKPLPREPWLSWGDSRSRLELHWVEEQGAVSPRYILEFVVSGISFFETSPLPLDVVITDDELAVDLSSTVVSPSQIKQIWLERVEELFQRSLLDRLGTSDIFLDRDGHSIEQAASALVFLPYILNLPTKSELQKRASTQVHFRDVFQSYWSLADLRRLEEENGRLFVVSAVPQDSPRQRQGQQPVLLWSGETKRYGNPIFKKLQSGAGYLYSLKQGEDVQAKRAQRDGELLASVSWSDGKLGLKSYGEASTRCEVELSGHRRKSEVIHLEPPAPAELRLLWESVDEIASWSWEPSFQLRFRDRVVELVDQSLRFQQKPSNWLLDLLKWAEGVSDLQQYQALAKAPIFAGVDGRSFSFEQLKKMDSVPVLADRSASIPEELPYPILLWDDPLLARLGFSTKDVAADVRAAYFKEQGRNRWLARNKPCEAKDWSTVRGYELIASPGEHLVFEVEGPSRVVIWREGRPLGREWILEEEKPGRLLTYQDDKFPADSYWSGPDQTALEKNRGLFLRLLDSPPSTDS